MAAATKNSTKKLRDEATCAICLGLMTEPVSIDCGHNFCHECIVGLLENQSSEIRALSRFHCPQCRKPFKSDSLRPNKQLQNIIETIKEMDNEMLCNEHGEKLHLFCKDDGQLICLCCERTKQHRGHVTALVEDACGGYKEQLQKALTKLKDTEGKYMQRKLDTTKQISNVEETTKCEIERIQNEFTNLHIFLHKEEELYMCRLEKDKEQKLSTLRDYLEHLENKLQELKKCILELDKKRQGSAHDLLQDIKGTLSRSSAISLETPKDVSLELETGCNVSELYTSMIKVLKSYVGLCLENVSWDITESESGFWAIRLCSVKDYLALTSSPTPLPLKNKPKVVGIILDCDAGTVSFYNITTGSHIYTFPKASSLMLSDLISSFIGILLCP